RYLAFLRGTRTPHDPFTFNEGQSQRVRYVRAAWSDDFEHWSEPVEVFRCDERDGDPHTQAHQLSVTRRGSQFVGLLTLFHVHGFYPIPGRDLIMEDGPTE